MSIFASTDKKKDTSNWLDIDDLSLVDVSKDLNTSLNMEPKLFNKFSSDEVLGFLQESKLMQAVKQRGYPDARLHLDVLSDYDNRIYIRTKDQKILVHLRLKVSEFQLKEDEDHFSMIYIDWLLTQNVKINSKKIRKELYFGQDFPGLNVLNEITQFIRLLSNKMGTSGAFNVPEYFHDAVLFSRKFRFIDPEKEGIFRALVHSFRRLNLRQLSSHIHQNHVVYDNQEPYSWKYGEMITCNDPYLEKKIFNEAYYKRLKESKERHRFLLKK